jgi:lipopolysaccharide export system ATP-binding protein
MVSGSMQIRTDCLVKSYGGRRVVDGISLDVSQGEIVGLLGHNGAGKTTTFYMVVGLVRPESGYVWLDDRDVTPVPMYRRARSGLGYLPQEASVFRKLTVEENLRLVLQMAGLSQREQEVRVERLIHEFNLGQVRQQPGISLSGGERRRVEIARSMALRPAFILLDEPFTGVDPIEVNAIQTMVFDLKARNIGILITDHNVTATLAATDRAYIVKHGQIMTQGTPEQITNDPVARREYLGESFRL